MRAVSVLPCRTELRLHDVPEPVVRAPSEVLLRVLDVGICGTDREISAFSYGTPPPGEEHLVLGHECLAEVVEVGSGVEGLAPGDLVVPMVRRPCGSPGCGPCRGGRADHCRTGDYTEHGIKERHGFLTDLVVADEAWLQPVPAALRQVGVLVEPLTIAEKALAVVRHAWDRLPADDRDPAQGAFAGRTAVVLGAGPVGLLGAMALVAEGCATWVYSRSPEPNPKADLVHRIGATYVSSSQVELDGLLERTGGPVDVIYEAAGNGALAFGAIPALGPNGVCAFTGVVAPEPPRALDVAALTRQLVLGNQQVVGVVNAGPQDHRAAVAALGGFVARWGGATADLITGRHPLEAYEDLLTGPSRGIKDVVAVADGTAG